MINSLSEELSKSYIGYDLNNPLVNRFMDSLITSCGGQEELTKAVNLINLPWMEDTVDVMNRSLFRHD